MAVFNCNHCGYETEPPPAAEGRNEWTHDWRNCPQCGGTGWSKEAQFLPLDVAVGDAAGNPLAGVPVWLSRDEHGQHPAASAVNSDGDGRVHFDVPAGRYYLWCEDARAANPQTVHVN